MSQIPDFRNQLVRITEERLHSRSMGVSPMVLGKAWARRPCYDRIHIYAIPTIAKCILPVGYYFGALVGDKWLCVVVKYADDDAFVITAYLADKIKPGEQLWPPE